MAEKKTTRPTKNTEDKKPNMGGNLPLNKKPKFNSFWIYIIIVVTFMSFIFFSNNKTTVKSDWPPVSNEFIKKGNVERVVILLKKAEVDFYIKEEVLVEPRHEKVRDRGFGSFSKAGPHYKITIGNVEVFERRLDEV